MFFQCYLKAFLVRLVLVWGWFLFLFCFVFFSRLNNCIHSMLVYLCGYFFNYSIYISVALLGPPTAVPHPIPPASCQQEGAPTSSPSPGASGPSRIKTFSPTEARPGQTRQISATHVPGSLDQLVYAPGQWLSHWELLLWVLVFLWDLSPLSFLSIYFCLHQLLVGPLGGQPCQVPICRHIIAE